MKPQRPRSSGPTRGKAYASRRTWVALGVATSVAATGLTIANSQATESPVDPAAKVAPIGLDGSFETGTSDWFVPTGDKLSRISDGHNGEYAVRVTQQRAPVATTLLNDRVNAVASTTAGQTYTATAWVRTLNPAITVNLRLMEYSKAKVGGRLQNLGAGQQYQWLRDSDWHRISVTYKAKADASSLDLNVVGWDLQRGASFDVDEVTVNGPVTGPAPRPTQPSPVPSPSPSVSLPPAPPPAPLPGASAIFPAQGTGAILGFWAKGGADVRNTESKINAQFGAVHRYRDFDGTAAFPTEPEMDLARSGHLVHYSWETMSYDGGYDPALQPAPGMYVRDAHSNKMRKVWTYRQITNGASDRYIDGIASRVKSAPGQYLIDFNHEADDTPDAGGSNTQRAAAGSRAEYAAAYRYLVNRFRAAGVKNVTWGWTVSGWFASDTSKWHVFQEMWPGKGYVDIVMWDPYNSRASDWRSFTAIASRMYDALNAGMLDPVDPSAKDLPAGLGEFGSINDGGKRPAWLRSVPRELRAMPDLVYANYFSSGQWGNLLDDASSLDALGDAARDPYFVK